MGADNFLVSGQQAPVSELDEENLGAFLHFNLDDDNKSYTQQPRPSDRPGADYEENTDPVTGENDLLPSVLTVKGLEANGFDTLAKGKAIVTITGAIRGWKAQTKGSDKAIFNGTVSTREWDLSDIGQRIEFRAIAKELYVEGKEVNAAGTITFEFQRELKQEVGADGKPRPKAWESLGSDTVKYTPIAAIDGKQPLWNPISSWTSRSQYKDTAYGWPKLIDCEFSVLGPRDVSYNCWAWSIGRSDAWLGWTLPDETPEATAVVNGVTVRYVDIGQMWGGHFGPWTTVDFDKYYAAGGVEPYLPPPPYKYIPATNLDEADVLLYLKGTEITHGAKKHTPTQSGQGKWRMFESKLGKLETIEHTYDQLSGGSYGSVYRMYKKVPR